ncbi:hypothetical protein [Streptomyces sp. NPDC002825]|uniref:hypothetical protein n=1 Tax=Streptomyces sp. NPDC002825 TaxID=3154666 RepID=UPI00332ABA66
MNMVNVVLVCAAVVSVPACVFSLMVMAGSRQEAKKMKVLEETGVLVQARLAHLVPFGNKGDAHVRYEFPGPNGETARYDTGVSAYPVHVVGETYPLVHHPRNAKSVYQGTRKAVRTERRAQEGFMKAAGWIACFFFLTGALSITALAL